MCKHILNKPFENRVMNERPIIIGVSSSNLHESECHDELHVCIVRIRIIDSSLLQDSKPGNRTRTEQNKPHVICQLMLMLLPPSTAAAAAHAVLLLLMLLAQ